MRTLTRARYKRKVQVPSGRKLTPMEFFDLRGLDQTTPPDVLDPRFSPNLRNARMLARDDSERQVAIKTRKGPGHYSVPVGETIEATQTSTTGADDQIVNTVHWLAQKWTAGASGRLTRVDLNLKDPGTAIGSVIIQIHADDGGVPGDLLATSSIHGSDIGASYAYEIFRFVEAPTITSASVYWMVAHLQEGGENSYDWSSTTNTTTGLTSSNSGSTWTALGASLNFKTYLSTSGGVKGVHRYYPTSNTNETLFAHGTVLYKVNDGTGAATSVETGFSSTATQYFFETSNDIEHFVNGVDVPKQYNGTAVTSLGGSPGVSSLLAFHKNRLFLTPVSDPTRINFSDIGDYETYGATSFLYVPAPKVSDPIVRILPFQDNLVIATRNSKYVLYGSDLSNFTLRQSIGKKGAVGSRAIDADENYVYLLSDDGFYRWNGSQDEYISEKVQPELDSIGNFDTVHVRCWNNQVRIYYASAGSATHDRCLIWDKVYEQWFLDTDTYFGFTANMYKDNNKLAEASNLVGAVYYAEQDYNIVGKPIDFQYWTKYHSFGNSSAKKQIRRLYPLFRSQETPFEIEIQVDKDLRGQPVSYPLNTQGEGPLWGEFSWGDGTEWGSTALIDPKLNIAGQAIYFQLRFIQNGANTPIELLGYILYVRLKRPK